MLSKVKVQGKTVSEAISAGLKELRLRRDQVEITVLEQPKKGFLGIGSKPAVVEVRKKRWANDNLDSEIYMDVPKRRRGNRRNGRGRNQNRRSRRTRTEATGEARTPRTPKANEPQLLPCEAIQNAVVPENLQAPLQEAKTYIENVLTHMGVKAENVHVWWDEKQQRILVTFDCDKPAIVIGKEGKTLEALEYLCTLAVTRKYGTPLSVVADTQNYWRKMEDKIDNELAKAIDMIKNGASVFRFRPMSSQLRRYIHRAAQHNEYVQTSSEGEGKWRKVTLRPTQKALDEAKANVAPADFVPGVIGEDIPQTPETDAAAQTAQTSAETQTAQTDAAQTQPTTTPAENAEPVVMEETPTQRMVSQSTATTVASTVVETAGHVVEERAVIVTTETTEK